MSESVWRPYFDNYSALRAIAYGEPPEPNPLVDQLGEVVTPKDWNGREVRQPSPAARFHPEISAGVDRAREVPPMFNIKFVRQWLPRILSNTGRGLLPYKETVYTPDELREHERQTASAAAQRERDDLYELLLDALDHGGAPTETVIVHSKIWTYDLPVIHRDVITEERTMQPTGTTTVLAVPVPMMWTQRRVARLIARGCWDCYWCDENAGSGRAWDDYLLVGCGATLRVFPTCPTCRDRFDRDTEWSGLDWEVPSDRWLAEVGYPSDECI